MSAINHFRSVMRRASRGSKLNILVLDCTHERYESNLCKTGHNFYVYKMNKEWNTSYAQIPDNYMILDYVPNYIDYDLILIHATDHRLEAALELSKVFNVPIIRHTHTLPSSYGEIELHQSTAQLVNKDSFISDFSLKNWGYEGYENANFINHGIDYDFWASEPEYDRENHCLSVVNYWQNRDWACGWNLWNQVISHGLLVRVVGDNPGISRAPRSIQELSLEYKTSSVFLNTSLNSPVPMSLMEAMASGCAIVTTDNCMIGEIIDGSNGFKSNDPEELHKHCKFLLENPDHARQLGLEAQKTIRERYNMSNFVDNWNSFFNSTIYN